METTISSKTKSVVIGPEPPFVIIGERINPSGYKRLREALNGANLSLVREEAIAQAQAGALVIDVNVGSGEVVEEEILPRAIQAVAEAVDVPICIDTLNYEAGLGLRQGRGDA